MTTMTSPTIMLIAGHWLGAWAWDEVIPHLAVDSSRIIAMTLPGFEEHDIARASKSLDEQAEAIVEAITRNDGSTERPVVLVAHSGANAPVSIVLDQHPELVARVVWVDSGPPSTGTIFAPDLPEEVVELSLPEFEDIARQASLEGLSVEALERFRDRAVPVPGPVLRQTLELSNDRRRRIPTTLICCSISSAQVMELAQTGHPMFVEVASLENFDFIDLPTGHWPMWSRPADLANAINAAVSGTA